MTRVQIRARHEAELKPVPIASDAAMVTRGVADGRLIPLLILDTSRRPDIDDMIRAHAHSGPGDVSSVWSRPSRFDANRLRLVLSVTKPSYCVILLEFDDLSRQGGTIDQIMQSQCLYLQAGRPGDRLSTTFDHPRIIVEVPSRHFRSEWDGLLRKSLVKEGRRQGLARGDARDAAERIIRSWRDLVSQRMASEHDLVSDHKPDDE